MLSCFHLTAAAADHHREAFSRAYKESATNARYSTMKHLTLNGEWQMHESGSPDWHAAQVPGSVYADLLRDGSIDDPFWRENAQSAFDLSRKDYEYVRTFTLSREDLAHERILLHCGGLDTLAHVRINGEEVGHADNMHVTWEWEVKPFLRAGENEILIHFDSPVEWALAEYERSPGWGFGDAIPGFPHVRKAHCMYGWDWGPRLPDAGIWRDIELQFVDSPRLLSVLVLQHHEDGQVRLSFQPETEGELAVHYTVTAPDGQVWESGGEDILIENPRLWWPAGYGDQPLYTVKAQTAGSHWERRIGLRTLTVSREKDQWGEEFCHIVNGVKIFAMGADYIPEDNLLSRVNPERTRRLLEDARLANMNTIRVWGGGYYPDDYFFDICDELGLLVWQDLMYACAFYELTPAFEKSIRLETEQNVKRLRHHASLAVICGNNENELFLHRVARNHSRGMPGPYEPTGLKHFADYTKMYSYILPAIVQEHAPQTFWWPSSPSCGGDFDDPNAENRGDAHYWDVWHGEEPFTAYRQYFFRYVSEFGFQSFPCLKTVESFTLPEDRNIFSRVMERHQRNAAANGKILAYLSQTYKYPANFDNLLYASQLLQADAIRYGVEHWRRNRGRCMGAVIWQLNDCWPVASWSSIDYFGRWKAMHYLARRFFAPIMISAEETGELTENPKINEFHPAPIDCSAKICVANETRSDVSGLVHWALRDNAGRIREEGNQPLTVPALSSVWLDRLDFTGRCNLTSDYLSFTFSANNRIISEGTALFCAPKHFEWRNPHLTCRRDGEELVISGSAFAHHVWIESEDPDALFSDNCFDLHAGERRIRRLRGSADDVRLRCVYDL